MTKIDYILVAEAINKQFKSGEGWPTDDAVELVRALAHALQANNSKFQWKKFMDAVYDDLPTGFNWAKLRTKSEIIREMAVEKGWTIVEAEPIECDPRDMKGFPNTPS